MAMQLIQLERITKLGRVGELLAAERLKQHGFTEVEDLNQRRANYPFADLLAVRDGIRYLIGVKTRNEMRQGEVGLNESYNLVLIRDATNAELQRQGKAVEQITSMMLAEVTDLASRHEATPHGSPSPSTPGRERTRPISASCRTWGTGDRCR
jgi:hypothetical protein